MEYTATDKSKKRIFTIPNMLSMVRIMLIPIIVWLYIERTDYTLAGIIVIISGVTDVCDGFIARKFDMTSDLGKVLDPIADKATQITVAILLLSRFPLMILPFVAGIIKELFMAISGYAIIRRCGIVLGACWHGKAATVVLTLTMILHLVWYNISPYISTATIIISTATISLSLVLYFKRNLSYLTIKQGV